MGRASRTNTPAFSRGCHIPKVLDIISALRTLNETSVPKASNQQMLARSGTNLATKSSALVFLVKLAVS